MTSKLTEKIIRDPNLKYIFEYCKNKTSAFNN